jgi:hypothetical protein
MPAETCAAHPAAAAAFRCDGCGKPLCHDCIQEGHRLLFCRLCGERALPLAPAAPATTPERRRAMALAAPYSFTDALRYPFRGAGGWLFGTYVVLLIAFALVESLPFGCAGTVLLRAFIAILFPGLLFAIVRQTAAGDDELPDWPDIHETGERLREILAFFVIGFLMLLPAAVCLRLGGCGVEDFLRRGPHSLLCWLLLALGIALGLVLAIPAIASQALYQDLLSSFRADLHARAFAAGGTDSLATLGLVSGLLLAGQLVAVALSGMPLLGHALEGAATAYALFTGAHAIGLLARRHAAAFDAIYLGEPGT